MDYIRYTGAPDECDTHWPTKLYPDGKDCPDCVREKYPDRVPEGNYHPDACEVCGLYDGLHDEPDCFK